MVIIENCKGDDKIVTKLGLDVENILDLDRILNGKFKFLHCQTCGGPILGHRIEKVRQLDVKNMEILWSKDLKIRLRQ